MNVREILEKRATLITNGREILDRADGEKRDMTAEERTTYDNIWKDVDKLAKDADLRKKQEDAEASLHETQPVIAAGNARMEAPKDEQRAAFDKFLRRGHLSEVEERTLTQSVEADGGYLVPEKFAAELIQGVDAKSYVRQMAKIDTISGTDSLGKPTLDTDASDAEWTGEITAATLDTAMKFGKRELKPQVLRKAIKISNALLRNSAINVEAKVRERLIFKFGKAMENGYLNGSGTNQPLGVFTVSANGINTDRDWSIGNTATALTIDGLLGAKFNIAEDYRLNAAWMFSGEAIYNIAKLKDLEGRYIWYGSVVTGAPDKLLNMPVHESAYVPHVFTANQYVGILGDFKAGYNIVDSLGISIAVAKELHIATGETGFYGEVWSDGQPILPEAFTRIAMTA
jgi:HK97 family phage major capsid protein